ncbi:MAG TPA: DUF982 domain-containing protein [Shinella sp.]|jgi:hypothetical protein|uniref:DUF982 domain-containing protein n=1 Tax=Shinella sp. TaxID=1870904 RepID=UPI0029BE6ED5|nr:DUF982 domain-containing protein [Shinella sp.]MDX3975137.1 DUF982 domain-containing protein [Shinella sp.]HEV7249513.1 DUF982 domain-containing protein [Shinella sp.]
MTTTTLHDDDRWLSPVFVRIGYGAAEAVRTPNDAMGYLHFRWPAHRGRAFDNARTLCAGAVEQNHACEGAREAFIRACIEAQILD